MKLRETQVAYDDAAPAKEADLLSFKTTDRAIPLGEIENEFRLMADACGKTLTPSAVADLCSKCGTHLLKLVSPRTDGRHAILRVERPGANKRAPLLPSVNAADTRLAKLLFRPLEIVGWPAKSFVDHVRNPDDISGIVLEAFSAVFGADALAAAKKGLLDALPAPPALPAGEFPIIFAPAPGGGDLQLTPVSPASSYMGFKAVADPYFRKQEKDAPPVARGSWRNLAVSAKMQNISGAIGGPRKRFSATMPTSLRQFESELFRFVHGGSFPLWREPDVADWVMGYADLLDAPSKDKDGRSYSNRDIRQGLDRRADRMIEAAQDFVEDTIEEARRLAQEHDRSDARLAPPQLATVLLRRKWENGQRDRDRARRALTSDHFRSRERRRREGAA